MRSVLIRSISLTIVSVVFVVIGNLSLLGADRSVAGDQQAAPAPSVEKAKLLVQQALEAETKGKSELRLTLLSQALQLDPELATAHWHSGDVKQNGKWMAFDGPSRDPKRTALVEEYRQRRDQSKNASDDQAKLARWCENAGLAEEAKTHWQMALKLNPRSDEARNKLGLVYYHKQFMPASEVESFDARAKQQLAENMKWRERLSKLRSQIENKQTPSEALQELREILDPAAIPAMEAYFARGKPEAATAVVQSLSRMPDLAATESLVRFATRSQNAEVRDAAARALKPRSMYAYVPLLLAGLDTPITVQYNKFQTENGSVGFQMSLYKDSPWGDKMYTSTGMMDTTWYPSAVARNTANVNKNVPSGWTPGRTIVTSDPERASVPVVKAAAKAEARANQALAANDDIAASNEHIISVLRTATGNDFGSDAMAWWNWWHDYNEYDRPQRQPTQYVTNHVSTSPYSVTTSLPAPPIPSLSPHSCFTAGTPVWTIAGLMQIENIKPGDLVLAQDTETGELAYKPVVKATIRPPSSLRSIRLGDILIRCTLGHPIWVSGAGWKMAKELQAGDWIHTVQGPILVDNVANDKDQAVAYNLVVADFDTYFVSKAMLLVHDNNLREPTEALVPGYFPEPEAQASAPLVKN